MVPSTNLPRSLWRLSASLQKLHEEIWAKGFALQRSKLYNLQEEISIAVQETCSVLNSKLLVGFEDHTIWEALCDQLAHIREEVRSFVARLQCSKYLLGEREEDIDRPDKQWTKDQQGINSDNRSLYRSTVLGFSFIEDWGKRSHVESNGTPKVPKKQFEDMVKSLKDVRGLLHPICEPAGSILSGHSYVLGLIAEWRKSLEEENIVYTLVRYPMTGDSYVQPSKTDLGDLRDLIQPDGSDFLRPRTKEGYLKELRNALDSLIEDVTRCLEPVSMNLVAFEAPHNSDDSEMGTSYNLTISGVGTFQGSKRLESVISHSLNKSTLSFETRGDGPVKGEDLATIPKFIGAFATPKTKSSFRSLMPDIATALLNNEESLLAQEFSSVSEIQRYEQVSKILSRVSKSLKSLTRSEDSSA
ncbi:hypothetical protein QFC20_003734 [Naganishia adeliensis]|uniref:Uncharacterized protein n=1 Tax=Naganishia adeliensis TaxID=92952 RepID=A0ACC2W9A6_9TREE|nr:hypothetical protein QFC20_003734 [Naganishia adeliensis]